jgi:hypothetical protein
MAVSCTLASNPLRGLRVVASKASVVVDIWTGARIYSLLINSIQPYFFAHAQSWNGA